MSRKTDIEQGILRVDLRLPIKRAEFEIDGLRFQIDTPDHGRPIEVVDPYDVVSDLGDLAREEDDDGS